MADRDPERAEDQNDLVEKTKKFLRDGCGCSHGAKGGPCFKELQEETVLFNLNNCLELTTAELDLVVLANIQAFTRSETIGTKRNRSPRSNFQFQSSCICKEMFLHLYGLSYSRFRRLKEHYEQHGIFNAQQDHLNHAQEEREHYRGACSDSATTFKALETEIALNEPHAACSMQGTMHYSFDYAQQVHIPSNPLQPGPIYFKTPRKCSIFGVICEAIPRQVNYLVDEATTAGKGANATISYVITF